MQLIKRTDGAFIIRNENYHVVPRSVDPFNKYDFDEIKAYADAHPEDVEDEPGPDLEAEKNRLREQVDTIREKRVSDGFPYAKKTIQADPISVGNANGFMTAIIAGIAEYPIRWITKENDILEFADAEAFKAMAQAMLGFVQLEFYNARNAKDAIIAAPDSVSALIAFESYRNAP